MFYNLTTMCMYFTFCWPCISVQSL